MKKNYVVLTALFLAVMMFAGFECSQELSSAKLYITQKNWDKAIDALKKETTKNPASDEGFYLMGSVYSQTDDIEGMIEAFDKSAAVSPKYIEDIKKIKKAYWADSYNKGVTFYNKAVSTQDKDTSKIFFDKSKESFKKSIKVAPDSVESYKILTMIYNMQRDWEANLVLYSGLYKVNKSSFVYSNLGKAYLLSGDAKIKQSKEKKREIDGTKDVAKQASLRESAMSDSIAGKALFEKAISVLEEGRTVFSKDVDIITQLALVYELMEKPQRGIEVFKEVIKNEPNNKTFRLALARFYLSTEILDLAIEQAQEAVNLDNSFLEGQYILAFAYARLGTKLKVEAADKKDLKYEQGMNNLQKAKTIVENLTTKKSNEALYWDLLARVYSNLGMTEEATKAFKKVDELK